MSAEYDVAKGILKDGLVPFIKSIWHYFSGLFINFKTHRYQKRLVSKWKRDAIERTELFIDMIRPGFGDSLPTFLNGICYSYREHLLSQRFDKEVTHLNTLEVIARLTLDRMRETNDVFFII